LYPSLVVFGITAPKFYAVRLMIKHPHQASYNKSLLWQGHIPMRRGGLL
jgi:hypothetical protein